MFGFVARNVSYSYHEPFSNLPKLNKPVNLLFGSEVSNQVYVLDQEGVIYSFENSENANNLNVMLDIRDRVYWDWEGGLIGFALHPEFDQNGHAFTFYTILDKNRNQTTCDPHPCLQLIVSRFTVSLDKLNVFDPLSELNILTIPLTTPWHRGGQLLFKDDGYLYVHIGEANRGGENLNNFYGKVLRLNVDQTSTGLNYTIPVDNPLYDLPGDNITKLYQMEIYAYGFRNPWRASYDQLTGLHFVADVGDLQYEEINIVEKGKFYGWKFKEGVQCSRWFPDCETVQFDPDEEPFFFYTHNDTGDINIPYGSAIIGGYVYRGSIFSELYGDYVFADYSGGVWSLEFNLDTLEVNSTKFLFRTLSLISSIAVDPQGELFFVGHSQGTIYKLSKFNLLVFEQILKFVGISAIVTALTYGGSFGLAKFKNISINSKTKQKISLGVSFGIVGIFLLVWIVTSLYNAFLYG